MDDDKNLKKTNQTSQEQSKEKRIVQVSQTFLGPLPPPTVLEHYERILPGAADRIISMAEQQSKHRQEQESKIIRYSGRDSLLGLIFGLIIGLTAIIGGVICILHGYAISGVILGGSGLAGLVGVFVYGSREKKEPSPAEN
jgi:uncharacterized membrane protein